MNLAFVPNSIEPAVSLVLFFVCVPFSDDNAKRVRDFQSTEPTEMSSLKILSAVGEWWIPSDGVTASHQQYMGG